MTPDRLSPSDRAAAAIRRTFAAAFIALRELDRDDPVASAGIRQTVAGEVQDWYRRDAVPLDLDAILHAERGQVNALGAEARSTAPALVVIALVARLRAAESARDAVVAASYEHGKVCGATEMELSLALSASEAACRGLQDLDEARTMLAAVTEARDAAKAHIAHDDAQAMLEEVAAERDGALAEAEASSRIYDALSEEWAARVDECTLLRQRLAGLSAAAYLAGTLTPAEESAVLDRVANDPTAEAQMSDLLQLGALEEEARNEGGE